MIPRARRGQAQASCLIYTWRKNATSTGWQTRTARLRYMAMKAIETFVRTFVPSPDYRTCTISCTVGGATKCSFMAGGAGTHRDVARDLFITADAERANSVACCDAKSRNTRGMRWGTSTIRMKGKKHIEKDRWNLSPTTYFTHNCSGTLDETRKRVQQGEIVGRWNWR